MSKSAGVDQWILAQFPIGFLTLFGIDVIGEIARRNYIGTASNHADLARRLLRSHHALLALSFGRNPLRFVVAKRSYSTATSKVLNEMVRVDDHCGPDWRFLDIDVLNDPKR